MYMVIALNYESINSTLVDSYINSKRYYQGKHCSVCLLNYNFSSVQFMSFYHLSTYA